VADPLPVLWHLQVSHYSEKVRWALAHKDIEHRRRAPIAGAHMAVALWLTRGASYTLPVLTMDGRNIGDSTAIIAELERRFPARPLYPEDADERRRALELEEHFDEQLGPYVRRLAFHELRNDPERLEALVKRTQPAPLARMSGAATSYARAFTGVRFGAASSEAAGEARAKVLEALDRLEEELDSASGDYLVGDRFTVADLTAAALFYPLVLPDEGPVPTDEPPAAGLERFREPLKARRGFKWVEEMFRLHRRRAGAKKRAPTA
jgi:glutathione S-transferase